MSKYVILSCSNFLSLRETSRRILSGSDNFMVSVTEEELTGLSEEDLKKLADVNLTNKECNVKIMDTLGREDLPPRNVEFYIKEKEIPIDIEVSEPLYSYREKHMKRSKPYCPKNIINKNYNSKKRGGR